MQILAGLGRLSKVPKSGMHVPRPWDPPPEPPPSRRHQYRRALLG